MYGLDTRILEPSPTGRPRSGIPSRRASRSTWRGDVLVVTVVVIAISTAVGVAAAHVLGSWLLGFVLAGLLFIVGAAVQPSLAGSSDYRFC